jgi:hypothetical protein
MERFWTKVLKKGSKECWPWLGGHKSGGYGCFYFREIVWSAHRVSYFLSFGNIPNGLHILHKCDNTNCVNPSHLFSGTHSDNMRDMFSKKRWTPQKRTTCPHGHKFEGENIRFNKHGHRQCVICARENGKKYMKLLRDKKKLKEGKRLSAIKNRDTVEANKL